MCTETESNSFFNTVYFTLAIKNAKTLKQPLINFVILRFIRIIHHGILEDITYIYIFQPLGIVLLYNVGILKPEQN